MPCACPMCRAQQRERESEMNGLSGQVCCRVHWAACLCSQGRRINPDFAAGLCPNVYQEMHAHRKGVRQTLYVESSLKKTGGVLSYKGKKFLTPKAGVTVLYPLWQLSHLCGDAECFQYSVMSRSPHTPLNHTSSLHTFTLNHSRTPLPEVPGDPDFLHFFYSIRSYLFPHFLFICPSLLLSQVWHFSSIFPQSSCHLELGKCPLPPVAHTVD